MKATRKLTITLELTEAEACDVYIHLNPEYGPNCVDEIKNGIRNALGYEPQEAPSL